MSRRVFAAALVAAAAACGALTEVDDGGAVTLEVLLPASLTLEHGQTVVLRARALNARGDSLEAPLEWRSPDTTLAVDTPSGAVTGRQGSGTGRVQVLLIGSRRTLASDFVTFTLQPRADTLIRVSPDSQHVAATEPGSGPLDVRLESRNPAGPLNNRMVTWEIVEPVFTDPSQRSVELPQGLLVSTLSTGFSGSPPTPPVLLRRAGVPAPARAVVEVRAVRASGSAVPGSGQRFVIRFDN